ncbi:MAG: hypothetical protein LUO93_10030 [Methanomicrobiales archaeon]|nr:hypothetical protein [Methanomicrobiales archaeon]
MLITGEPSSELQQYLHRDGQPSVGISITWKGLFIVGYSLSVPRTINLPFPAGNQGGTPKRIMTKIPDRKGEATSRRYA